MVPHGHETVHVGDEAVVVVTFEQVDQFVDDDVFQTMPRFFDQFEIEPDAAGFDVAGAHLVFICLTPTRRPSHR